MKNNPARSPRWQAVKRLLGITIVLAVTWTQNACVHESARQISPSSSSAKIAAMRNFYVRQHARDDHNLAADISGELQKSGLRASVGTAKSAPRPVDAVVTYEDRWMWDITMYMWSLDVQLREPGSDVVLATSKTVRSSLVRRSQKEMVQETVAKIFGKDTP